MSKKLFIIIIFYFLFSFSLTGCSKSQNARDNSSSSTTDENNPSDVTYDMETLDTDIYDWGVLLPEERYMKLDSMYLILTKNGIDSSLFPSYEDALILIDQQLELDVHQTKIFDCLCLGLGLNPIPYHPK